MESTHPVHGTATFFFVFRKVLREVLLSIKLNGRCEWAARLASTVRLPGFSPGQTGTVTRVVYRLHGGMVAGYLVRLDRRRQGAPVKFYPDELEPIR
jgi:hypothetical protein